MVRSSTIKTELWRAHKEHRYLLYVCDHHFSIAYGRPPVIHDHEPMRQWELYLQSPLTIEGDTGLLCQVSLFVVMTRIYHFYEDEAESEVSEDSLSHLRIFNEQIDSWQNTWRPRIRTSPLPVSSSCTNAIPSRGQNKPQLLLASPEHTLSLRQTPTQHPCAPRCLTRHDPRPLPAS
jgi:hypothetical protein